MNPKILAPVAMGAAINIVHAVPKGHGAVVTTAIGNVALALVLSGIAEVNDELGTAFAITYLLGSLLVNGKPFIEWFDVVIGGSSTTTTTPKGNGNA